MNKPATKVTTGKVRLSYVSVLKPNKDGKYSVTLLIEKSEKDTLNKIKTGMTAAQKSYTEKTGKKAPQKHTLHDGDGLKQDGTEYGPECKGCYVMTVSSKLPPTVVDKDKNEIIDERDIYSGCYGRAVINFYVYDTQGNRGVSAGLNGVMKLSDGEPLGGSMVRDEDWDDGWTDPDGDNAADFDLLGGNDDSDDEPF